jgi:hypothetical protein
MGFAPDTPQGVWFDTVFSPAFNDYGAAYVAWINPAGQHGVELGWDVSDVAPARWEDLRHSAFDTHTPEYDGECDYPVDPVAIGSGQWLTPL